MPADQELLRAFADEKSEAAFAALVQRHLPMIYAAACRQTGDAHRGEEVALAAFTLLARKARSLRDHPAIGGWLYTTTGHLAARLRRTEARRVRREQEAHAMNETEPPAGDITRETLRPIVDEFLLALPERDRTAVLLRFFENHTHGQIGARLGLSENAARMRVDRALEQLRVALQRRGIVSTATALGTALAAHATLVPPAGLAAGVVASASAVTAGGGLLLLMNTSILKTGLVTAVVAVGAGGLLWQHHENAALREEVASLAAQLKTAGSASGHRPTLPPPDPTPTAGNLAHLSAQVATLANDPAASWQERASILEELMGRFPEAQIPELALATPEDWLDATKQPLTSDADYRRALAQVRTAVVMRFSKSLNTALQAYLTQHGGTFPTDPAQLETYFTNPIGPEVWQRYKVVPASRYPTLQMGGDALLVAKSPVDPEYDMQIVIGPQGMGSMPHRTAVIRPVVEAYLAANPGKQPASFADLLPYTKTNSQRAAIQAEISSKPGP